MGTTGTRSVLLTWDDIAAEADHLDPDLRRLLLEIVGAMRPSVADEDLPDGRWYLADVRVCGHVGIGKTPLTLRLPPTNGITIISARNGVGKTSAADAIRHTLSDGQVRSYQLADQNLHCPDRSIKVTVTNGTRNATIVCGLDDTICWRERSRADGALPRWWMAAFERYRPVLLYPEIAPLVERPGNLHEFLKGSLELTVLEQVLTEVDRIRKEGREAIRQVEVVHQRAIAGIRGLGDDELVTRLATAGPTPSPGEADVLRQAAAGLPASAPVPPELVGTWVVDETLAGEVVAWIAQLRAAQRGVVQGAKSVQAALDRLLRDEGAFLSGLRDRDVCPVCQTQGAGWVATATVEADRMRGLLAGVRAAERGLEQDLTRVRASLPPGLPARTREALVAFDDPQTQERITQWQKLAAARERLSIETATVDIVVEPMLTEAADLAGWYDNVKAAIGRSRDVALETRAAIRTHIETWLERLDQARDAMTRSAAADRLSERVVAWIKHTRTEIFAPIAKEIVDIWSVLTSDADLEMTDISLGGGVRQAHKVNLALTAQGAPVPGAMPCAEVMSTGQRNALSLATYLPRATQPHTPFGFLVLDDPIHDFDDWRVRYLSRHLASLADRYQIVVFTHDDRLWRELRASGLYPTHYRLDRPPEGQSHVRVTDITRPSAQMLDEVQQVLRAEGRAPFGTAAARTAMTLACCRQAIDTEVSTQLDILGRRLGKSDEQIRADQAAAGKTRDQLTLLSQYATAAGLNSLDYAPFDRLITVLNAGAHGRAPHPVSLNECRERVKQSRELAKLISCMTR